MSGAFELTGYIIGLIANILTIVASSLAIWVFFFKGPKVSRAIDFILGLSFQTTLFEFKQRIERLNDYSANDSKEVQEVRSILHELAGQIRGNQLLSAAMPDMAQRLEAECGKIKDPKKRALIAELREKIRAIEVNMDARRYSSKD